MCRRKGKGFCIAYRGEGSSTLHIFHKTFNPPLFVFKHLISLPTNKQFFGLLIASIITLVLLFPFCTDLHVCMLWSQTFLLFFTDFTTYARPIFVKKLAKLKGAESSEWVVFFIYAHLIKISPLRQAGQGSGILRRSKWPWARNQEEMSGPSKRAGPEINSRDWLASANINHSKVAFQHMPTGSRPRRSKKACSDWISNWRVEKLPEDAFRCVSMAEDLVVIGRTPSVICSPASGLRSCSNLQERPAVCQG